MCVFFFFFLGLLMFHIIRVMRRQCIHEDVRISRMIVEAMLGLDEGKCHGSDFPVPATFLLSSSGYNKQFLSRVVQP